MVKVLFLLNIKGAGLQLGITSKSDAAVKINHFRN